MHFKKIIFIDSKGLTLTELLMASIIVGIVMVGAISVDFAIRRSQRNVIDASHIAINLQAAMMQMTRDARLTTGDGNNPGISCCATNICFRQDNGNPNSYADDNWACYSIDAANNILRCTIASPGTPTAPVQCPQGGAYNCPVGSTQMVTLSSPVFFSPRDAAGNVIASVGTAIATIEFDLTTRANPVAAANYITNPEYHITSRINPPALSR